MSQQRTTEFAILGLLSIQPMSGYDIRKSFGEDLAYFWNESFGQIYPALERLKKEMLVAAEPERGRSARRKRMYALTAAGRSRLRKWLSESPHKQPMRNEFLLKLFLGRSAPAGALEAHIREKRKEHEEALAMFVIIRESVVQEHARSPHLKYWLLGLSHGMKIRRAEIDWCNEALRELEGRAAAGEGRTSSRERDDIRRREREHKSASV